MAHSTARITILDLPAEIRRLIVQECYAPWTLTFSADREIPDLPPIDLLLTHRIFTLHVRIAIQRSFTGVIVFRFDRLIASTAMTWLRLYDPTMAWIRYRTHTIISYEALPMVPGAVLHLFPRLRQFNLEYQGRFDHNYTLPELMDTNHIAFNHLRHACGVDQRINQIVTSANGQQTLPHPNLTIEVRVRFPCVRAGITPIRDLLTGHWRYTEGGARVMSKCLLFDGSTRLIYWLPGMEDARMIDLVGWESVPSGLEWVVGGRGAPGSGDW